MDDSDEEDETGGADLENFIELLDSEFESESRSKMKENSMPQNLDLQKIRDKGRLKCGYTCLAQMSTTHQPAPSLIVTGVNPSMVIDEVHQEEATLPKHTEITQKEIVRLILTKKTRRKRNFHGTGVGGMETETMEANGSCRSIIEWAKRAGLDQGQKRAFEVITGSFVLTFFNEAIEADDGTRTRAAFVREKRKLRLLSDASRRGDDQLICLLHGPGGCGKTTVIDLVVEYAREYCELLNQEFTSSTIVVTALTGVAASILLGETTHAAVHLNQSNKTT